MSAKPVSGLTYRGRFAPSPSGPLHFGSLIAAIVSFAEAKTRHGEWLLRIEDIDPPRAVAGADALILSTLEAYGFEWDGPVIYQSESREQHLQLIRQLIEQNLAYTCTCSRRQLKNVATGPLGTIYPGTCRQTSTEKEHAIRVQTHNQPIRFTDRLQGEVSQRLESESGDFIIHRRDGLIAYNFAVVVDDAAQGITDVVRGIDLLSSTPRHIYLQQILQLPTPSYAHIPVVCHPNGDKLSKLTGAAGIDPENPAATLQKALQTLGLAPPEHLARAPVAEIWQWFFEHWTTDSLQSRKTLPA